MAMPMSPAIVDQRKLASAAVAPYAAEKPPVVIDNRYDSHAIRTNHYLPMMTFRTAFFVEFAAFETQAVGIVMVNEGAAFLANNPPVA
jgi:hypothetical protein